MTISKAVDQSTHEQDIHTYLTELMQDTSKRYLAQEGLTIESDLLAIDMRPSAQASFGDYSMPVMPWTRYLKRPPMVTAKALEELLRAEHDSFIDEITVTKPGFLNFRLNRPTVARTVIEHVLEQGADFGQGETGLGTKVVVEHTNINSNKAAHVGHLRNACLGDTVVRMLRSQGYQVEANNYIDDTGVQVADVVLGFTLLEQNQLQLAEGNAQLADESFDYYCSRVYVAVGKAYENQPELKKLRDSILHAIENGRESEEDPDYQNQAEKLSKQIVAAHLATMARLNIFYDLLTWESAILQAGLWKRTFEMLRDQGVLEKPETGPAAGCWIVPFGEGEAQTSEGDQRNADKILVKSNGTATYTGKDIAYQLWKFGLADDPRIGVTFHFAPWGRQQNRHMLWTMLPPKVEGPEEGQSKQFGHGKRVINVIDVRQSYPQQVVYESLRRLGFTEQAEHSIHLAYEVVNLSATTAQRLGVDTSDGRDFYAMSGRKGIEIKADDLINTAVQRMREVAGSNTLSDETATLLAASAIRYFMIRFGLQQVISLDIDEALRSSGDTGVYLQYAHARANSILRRLKEGGYSAPEQLKVLPTHLEQSEWELLLQLDAYPRHLNEATEQLAPNTLAAFVFDLASHFHDFYEHTPPIVREIDEDTKAFRTHLVQATVQTMGNALRVLGFVPLEAI